MLKFLVAYMLMKDFVIPVAEEKVIYFSLNTRPRYSYGIIICPGTDTRVSWAMVLGSSLTLHQ